jgi:hypothetical protein
VSSLAAVRLTELDPDELVERIALRVVQLLKECEQPNADGLVDAATLARLLGVSRATVYEHAERLGAVRLGDGGRPRMRFDVELALEAWTGRPGRRESNTTDLPMPPGIVRRRSRPPTRSSAGLLPVKGQDTE